MRVGYVYVASCVLMYVTSVLVANYNTKNDLRHKLTDAMRAFLLRWRFAYNVYMQLASAVILYNVSRYALASVRAHGFEASVCDVQVYRRNIELRWWLAANMLMKGVEWVDTHMIAARRKRVTFLHAYHHAATFVLASVQFFDMIPMQWAIAVPNLAVHVVMYHFYAGCIVEEPGAESGAESGPTWRRTLFPRYSLRAKRVLTAMQIVQFCVHLALMSYGALTLARVGPGRCHATPRAIATGFGIITSYLVLFVRFYRTTYVQATKDE